MIIIRAEVHILSLKKGGVFHFQFSFVFIKVYCFVKEKHGLSDFKTSKFFWKLITNGAQTLVPRPLIFFFRGSVKIQ